VFVPEFEFICKAYGEWQTEPVTFRGVEYEHRATMLPRDEVELLARLSPFADWHVTGDFSDEPLADGHTTQVWALEKPSEGITCHSQQSDGVGCWSVPDFLRGHGARRERRSHRDCEF